MALAERVIAERELGIATRDQIIAAARARISETERDLALVGQRAADMESLAVARARKIDVLRFEVVRRAGWRWWLSLPLRRLRGTVATSVAANGDGG